MAYRNKVYVAFDGKRDINYYEMLTAWAANTNIDFDLNDAHDLNTAADSSQEESIKKELQIRFANSKLFILIIGESTRFKTKFVKWEIETAIRLTLPIICINLNGSRANDALMPPVLKNELAIYISFKYKIIKFAMDNWPTADKQYRKDGKTGPYYYDNSVYERLGLNA